MLQLSLDAPFITKITICILQTFAKYQILQHLICNAFHPTFLSKQNRKRDFIATFASDNTRTE